MKYSLSQSSRLSTRLLINVLITQLTMGVVTREKGVTRKKGVTYLSFHSRVSSYSERKVNKFQNNGLNPSIFRAPDNGVPPFWAIPHNDVLDNVP